jgi:uncharacterized protein (DUF1697 family)
MPVLISMLRGVNVGPHNRLKMDELRALYTSLGLRDVQTYVQSGNVVFRTDKSTPTLGKKIEDAIERKFGFRSDVVLRTAAELRDVVDRNPFAGRRDIVPGKLLVTFLVDQPPKDANAKLAKLPVGREEIKVHGRELYVYFPDGAGRSKLPWTELAKALGTTGTARNWNSVTKMLQMAEKLEESI